MTLDEAIKYCEDMAFLSHKGSGNAECEQNHRQLAEWLKELKQLRKQTRWIPVIERLPKDGERVLATHLGGLNPYKQVIEHIYVNGEFTRGWNMDMNIDSPTFGQRYMGRVIAWTPLPKPYKAERSDKK